MTVCRQGSYSFPTLRVLVNGTLDGDFSYAGTIYTVTVCLQGVLFSYPAQFPERCDTYDNPFG